MLFWLPMALVACKSETTATTVEIDTDVDTDTDTDADADADTDTDTDTDADTDADTDTDTDTDVSCTEDPAEPNDTQAEAIPSEGSAGAWVEIGAPDFWGITVQPGEQVRATVTHDRDLGDIDVYILDEDGQVVGRPGATVLDEERATACNRREVARDWAVYVEVWEASIGTCNTYDWTLTRTPGGCPPVQSGQTGDTGFAGTGTTGDTGHTGHTGTP